MRYLRAKCSQSAEGSPKCRNAEWIFEFWTVIGGSWGLSWLHCHPSVSYDITGLVTVKRIRGCGLGEDRDKKREREMRGSVNEKVFMQKEMNIISFSFLQSPNYRNWYHISIQKPWWVCVCIQWGKWLIQYLYFSPFRVSCYTKYLWE